MKPCSFSGCDRELYRSGLCHGHRGQKNLGKALTVLPIKDPVARFWEKVDKSGECWEHGGGRNRSGYPSIRWNGKMQRAHRVSWELHRGPIPEGMQVLHACDNRPCIRPDHLFLGDNDINVADKVSKDRQVRGERVTHRKLNENQVAEIRTLRATMKVEDLGERFGVSGAHVSRICLGRFWKGRIPVCHAMQAVIGRRQAA